MQLQSRRLFDSLGLHRLFPVFVLSALGFLAGLLTAGVIGASTGKAMLAAAFVSGCTFALLWLLTLHGTDDVIKTRRTQTKSLASSRAKEKKQEAARAKVGTTDKNGGRAWAVTVQGGCVVERTQKTAGSAVQVVVNTERYRPFVITVTYHEGETVDGKCSYCGAPITVQVPRPARSGV